MPFRRDRIDKGGGLLLYLQEHIPCKHLQVTLEAHIDAIFVEINLKKRKWLLICGYNPAKKHISTFVSCIENKLNELCKKHENIIRIIIIIMMGDFNSKIGEEDMDIFCNTYNFKNLVKEPACFKSIENPNCVDLILSNKSLYFQHTLVIETGLSDFHKLTVTKMKSTFQKQHPKILNYRNYKCFNNGNFGDELQYEIEQRGGKTMGCILNKHAPRKKRLVRANL